MADVSTSVGQHLRAWRQTRGLSQFELATKAGFSTRHISFVETGRAHPSREAMLAFGKVLNLPLREQNRLLEAAGFARVFRETPLSAEEMAHLRGMLQFILDRHLPYAAVVVDRYWNCLLANRAATQFFQTFASPALSGLDSNILRATFHPEGTRRWIVNWAEVERHLLNHAEISFGSTEDSVGVQLLAEVRSYGSVSTIVETAQRPGDLLLPIHLRMGDLELRLFSAIMTLCRPQNITLEELRVETWFPADQESDRCWKANFPEPAAVEPVT